MIVTIVIPRRESAFSVAIIEAAAVASSPEVGSSRNKAIGAAANSIPILTLFLCPPEITGAAVLPTRES
jgi:hypothetical protein